jgi:ribosomal protein S18 acetylase RimI-like enzyme
MPTSSTEQRPPLAIRRATPADLDVVVELRLALLRTHRDNPVYGRLRPDARRRARRLFAAQLANEEEVTFLAERSGVVVGILRSMIGRSSPLLEPAHFGYVASVYVRPAARRAGVLTALLAEAESWCRARGVSELRLHNAADNPLANATWDALGFAVVEYLRVRPLAHTH